MSFNMRDRVHVYHRSRWHAGKITGISCLPEDRGKYDVQLDDRTVVFSCRAADLKLIEERPSVHANDNRGEAYAGC